MKNIALLLLAFSLFGKPSNAQIEKKHAAYRCWVGSTDGLKKGRLAELSESSILLSRAEFGKKHIELPVSKINSLKFRKKGRVWKGALVGAGVGFVVGALIGYPQGEDCEPNSVLCFSHETVAVAYGLFFGIPVGTLAGAAVGSVKVRIPISKSQSRYEAEKKRLEKFVASS